MVKTTNTYVSDDEMNEQESLLIKSQAVNKENPGG